MKKILVCIFLVLNIISLPALDLTGIEKWIINYPREKRDMLDYKITDCVIEGTGALLILQKADSKIRINIIKPILLEKLTEKCSRIEKTILNPDEIRTEKWTIMIKECEISFGFIDDITITLQLGSMRIRLNQETTLELTGKLEDEPLFAYQLKTNNFVFTVHLKDIAAARRDREIFPGWTKYMNTIVEWFEKGLDENNGNVIAVLYDTKVMKKAEKETEKRILLSKNEKGNVWSGLSFDYRISNLVSGERFGIYVNPFSYNMLQPMAFFDFRNIGAPDWLVKPFRFTIFLGGFLEFNAGFYERRKKDDFVGFADGPGSFAIAFGPSLGIGFSALVPRIVEGKHTDDMFGIGIELVSAVNVLYFLRSYAYEYFLNQYIDFVIHLFPSAGMGMDIIVGFNIAFATAFYDETRGDIYVDKFGLTIGARLKFDLHNYYKSDELYK
jgi:hypothetical protein